MAGIRDDARIDCAPIQGDLPARAVTGVECAPNTGLVDRFRLYRFATTDDLLATYLEDVADEGLTPGRGACFDGRGETAYMPGEGLVPFREACFVGRSGVSEYRVTYPEAQVLLAIVGRASPPQELANWAWEGNEDVPGSPTVWHQP
jgi:hypothetical protein